MTFTETTASIKKKYSKNLGQHSNSNTPRRKLNNMVQTRTQKKKEKNTPPEHKTTVSTHSMTQVALAFQAQWAVDIASATIL